MSVEELTAGLNEAQLREGAEEYSRLMQMLAPIADGVSEGPAPVDNLAPIPDVTTRPETRRKSFGIPQKVAAVALAGAAGFATFAPNFLQNRSADYKHDGTEVALPTNYVQLDGVKLVSVDASLTATSLPSADLATAKDCAPGEVKFYRTAGNEFGPAIAAGNIEETKAEIYTRLGQDPALLTDLYEVTGNASFSKEGRDEQIRKYMDDIGLREADCQKVIDIIEASEVTFDELSGLYITDYMTDKNGDEIPEIVKGLEKSAVNQRTLMIKIPKGPTIELKLGCGAQPGEEKEEERTTPTTKAVTTTTPTTSRITTTTGQTTSTTRGTTSTTMGTTSTTRATTSTTMGTTSTTMGTTSTTQPNTTTTVPPKDAEPPVTGGPSTTVPPVTEAPQPTNVPTTEATVAPSTEPTDVRQRVGATTELSTEAQAEVEAVRKAAETSAVAQAAAAHQRTPQAAAASTKRAGDSAAQRVTIQKQAQAAKQRSANSTKTASKSRTPAAEAAPAAAEKVESKQSRKKALTEKAASIVLPFLGFRRREEELDLELIRRS